MFTGPKIVTKGLVLALDAGNSNSYPGSGNTWKDLSGNGNNGTLVNGVGYDNSNGGALTFDGVDDRVTNTNDLLIFPNNNLTMSIWVKVKGKGDTSFNRFLDISPSTNRQNICYLYWDENDDRYGFGNGASFDTSLIRGEDPEFNVWQFWTGIQNSDSISTAFYVNGIEKASGADMLSLPNCSYSIAMRFDGLSDESNIDVSQVQIYNRALTPQEIQQNYNATKSRFGL